MKIKRILFCASVLALAASCTEDELGTASMQNDGLKGISFAGKVAESPSTKGEYQKNETGNYSYLWYAEKDRVEIWSTNTTGTNANNSATFDPTKSALYKATQSAGKGVFTGVDDANTLDFLYSYTTTNWTGKESEFFAVYSRENKVKLQSVEDGKFVVTDLPDLAKQSQAVASNTADLVGNMAQFSYTTAHPTRSYDAVGELIDMSFYRPTTGLIFSTDGVTEYSQDFGKLNSVTITMKGYDANGNGSTSDEGDIAPSYLTYGTDNAVADPETPATEKVAYVFDANDPTQSYFAGWDTEGSALSETPYDAAAMNAKQSIKLTLNSGSGLQWDDNKTAFMAIKRVDRKAFADKNVAESYEVTYEFANITLTQKLETRANWPSGDITNPNFLNIEALDISSFPYLVVGSGTDFTLIVNSGDISSILNTNKSYVKWDTGDVPVSSIKKINIGVELTEAEMNLLNTFTATTDLTLEKNTEIKANQIDKMPLTSLNCPNVTKIALNSINSDDLAVVKLPKYGFTDESVAKSFLNDEKLTTLDMSAVESISIAFPSTGFSLEGFTLLEHVTIKDGLRIGINGFKDCVFTQFENPEASVVLVGSGAFANCANLKYVKINTTESKDIPANSFAGCESLEDVIDAATGEQIIPTYVDDSAFQGCEALEIMDLSAATYVGNMAFDGCTLFYGTEENYDGVLKKIVKVGAETVGQRAFADCTDIVHIEFVNTTKIGDQVLQLSDAGSGSELKQIQFDKVVDLGDIYSADSFNSSYTQSTNKVDLFVQKGQSEVNSLNLVFNGISIPFKSITKL